MASAGQQPIQPPPRQSTVAGKVSTLKTGDKITVVFLHSAERYGTYQSSRQDDFTFYDVDQNVDLTIQYAEVKKVKNGYGGYNSVSHTHTDHTKAYVGIGIATSVIVGVVIAVAAAKN